MSEQDQSRRPEHQSAADQTLLGVAPPRIDSSAQLQRSPVYVRSGTSVADVDSPPRFAKEESELPVAIPAKGALAAFLRLLRGARRRPALWMVAAPVFVAMGAVWAGHHGHSPSSLAGASSTGIAAPATSSAAFAAPSGTRLSISDLEAKPPGSLSSRELLLLAEAHSETERAAAGAFRRMLEGSPSLAKDSAVQSKLLRLSADGRTARDALAAMVALGPPVGADLLYETWTRTPERTETTDLARAILYSPDVRPTASPALALALALRVAETCAQYKALLPAALKDGDRRSLQLLTKLNGKRGCGPKKADDCFACLRATSDELAATINAAKSRHPPSYAVQ